MIYTEEQLKILEKATPHFETVKRNYIRNAPRWLTEQIIEVYETSTGKHILSKDLNCFACVLNIYKLVGQTYYSDLAEIESKKIEDTEVKEWIETFETSNETPEKQKDVNETNKKQSETKRKTKSKRNG